MMDQQIPEQKEKKGVSNWRNLFRRPNGYEITIFIMLILGILMAYSYKSETAMCRYYVENIETQACNICKQNIKAEEFNQGVVEVYKNVTLNEALLNNPK